MTCIYKGIMKPAPLLLFLPLLLPVYALAARPLAKPELRLDGRYSFKDRGRPTPFRIATDELQLSAPDGHRRIPVSAKAHLRDIQQAAHDLSGGGKKFDLIAYPENRPPTEHNRRVVTNRVCITLNEGIDPTAIGLAIQAQAMKEVSYLPFDYILEFADAATAITSAEALQSVPGVLKAQVLLGQQVYPAYIPNDTFFASGTSSYNVSILADGADKAVTPGPGTLLAAGATKAFQWYLNKDASRLQVPISIPTVYEDKDLPPFVDPVITKLYPRYFESVIDLNVIPAWDLLGPTGSAIDGTGVKIGLVDDGAQVNPMHQDFNMLNILTGEDRNFLDGDQSAASVDPKRFDPTPPFYLGSAPNHGTAVAGLIVANRNNSKGISGIAPDAKLAAYRVVGAFIDPGIFADAVAFGSERLPALTTTTNPFGLPTGNEWRRSAVKCDISNNAWTYNTNGNDLIPMDLYMRKAMCYGATEGRVSAGVARGVIYVVPAGNDGDNHGDVNYSGQTNSPYTLTVGAVSDWGRRVSYSAPGAALHAVAPSSGGEMAPRIVAGTLKPAFPPVLPENLVDRALGWTLTPNEWDAPSAARRNSQQVVTLNTPTAANQAAGYNNNFGGTSAACAMASGVVALMLEANPALGWRDVQEIIMRSATVVDPMYGEWQYNPLGMPVSHKYGAGLIDAEHAVRLAKIWQNLGSRNGPIGSLVGTIDFKECKGESKKLSANLLIPDNTSNAPIKTVVNLQIEPPSSSLRIEHVVVRLKVSHGRRGDLGIVLTAPKSGQADRPVESYLMVPHREDYNTNIGLPAESSGGTDAGVIEGEYWDFTTVRHWGTTSNQNLALGPDQPNNNGQWTLTIWDNTNKGAVTSPSLTAANPEDRVYVPVGNPTNTGTGAARITYAEIIFHGSTSPSNNEPPTVNNNSFVGLTGAPFQGSVRGVSDTSTDPNSNTPRAGIYDYRIRVLNGLSANAPELIIAPSTAAEYAIAFPGSPAVSPAHLRFDRKTGLLTNAPYPGITGIPPFKPLPKASWQVELRATSIFGTTRRQIPFHVRDSLSYNEFKLLYFTPGELANPAISGDSADPDHDGLPNLMEYGMAGNPRLAEPALLPTQQVVGNNLIYTYQVDTSARGITLAPQATPSLSPLTAWSTLTPTTLSTDGNIQVRQVSLPIVPGTKQFIRLRVTTP